jgi:hypothetical protein
MSPSGSDSASGSISAPFKSLRFWTGGRLQAGDTVLARGGTYYDPVGAGSTWIPTVSGSATAPITIKAYPGETPIFNGNQAVQQAFVLGGVSYLDFADLAFTNYRPRGNGTFIISGSSHIQLNRIHFYGVNGADLWTDHLLYIASGSNDIRVDDSDFDGMIGAGIQIYSSNGLASTNIRVTNSRLTNNGWGFIAQNVVGATFTNNQISNNTIAFRIANASGLTINTNRISGPTGIWVQPVSGAMTNTLRESNDCLVSSTPFLVGYPGTAWSLAQWQAAGEGLGSVVGACPSASSLAGGGRS